MPEADRVYYNGTVHTLDGSDTVAEGIALSGDEVLATGESSAMRALATSGAAQHNLRGRTVIPGLIDSHNHLLGTGLNAGLVDLAAAATVADVVAAIVTRAAAAPAGGWIVSSSRWHESQLAEGRFPTRQELDAAAPAHPVLLRRGGHNIVVNSAAFRLAGVDERTEDPAGGTFVRGADGSLTGHVIGSPAFLRITGLMPLPDDAALAAAITRTIRLYNAAGLTSVIEPGLTREQFRVYRRLQRQGVLSLRTVLMPRLVPGATPAELARAQTTLAVLPSRSADDDELLKTGGIKIVADGGVETNYLREPYAHADDAAAPRGKPQVSPENLTTFCRLAARLGWQVGIHCVGDAAIDMVLDAFTAVNQERSIAALRWTLIHMTLARPEHFVRARALHLVLAVQQPLVYALGAGWVKYWGSERAAMASPMRAYVESGLPVGGGSDSPVTPYQPLLGIQSSVTRATQLAGVLGPEWGITPAEALRLYTTGSAYCSFDETRRGSLEPGKLADLVVLGADPLRVNPDEIASIPIEQTLVGGRVVFGDEVP